MITEFLLIAESGVLEKQSLLLCESIRRFGGRHARAEITVLQPRREKKISREGRLRLDALQARVVEMDIVSPCPEYGTSYRVFACADYEPSASSDCMIFLDSDIVMLAEPDLELQGADVAARPVDVKGMCTVGDGDANDVYWRRLCRACDVDYDRLPYVFTTVERMRVRASYNGGLTVVKTKAGLFQKTADFFSRSIKERLIPWPDRKISFPAGHGMVSVTGSQLWGSSQACCSLAITSLGLATRVLPPSVNFPLHLHADLIPEIKRGGITPVSLVHYHHVFRGPERENPIFAGMPGFSAGAIRWLRERIPEFA